MTRKMSTTVCPLLQASISMPHQAKLLNLQTQEKTNQTHAHTNTKNMGDARLAADSHDCGSWFC